MILVCVHCTYTWEIQQNRFRAPQPAEAWNSTYYASSPGPVCPAATSGRGDEYTIDEDCLNLNIWSAANSSDAKLPVAMWSYPAESTAADALFDGGGMADKGVVFVNYNYRAGSFGWLAHPELSAERYAETGVNSSGNWGMLDQQAALKWIVGPPLTRCAPPPNSSSPSEWAAAPGMCACHG